ncbi:MAG: hypothetical protein Fur0043_18900 [Anaerolineales bacterium]
MPVNYARSQGIRLLETAVQELGPLFTRRDLVPLAERQGLSHSHLSKLISLLHSSGHLEILKRGLYVVRSPLFTDVIHPFVIAAALVHPAVISHWSALAYHGFTTQLPRMVQVSTPAKVVTPQMRRGGAFRPRGRAVWQAGDIEVEFIYVRPSDLFGSQAIWMDRWNRVNLTDPERTALDLISRPNLFGGMDSALETLEATLPRLQVKQLVGYALQLGKGSVIKRLGWALEQFGVSLDLLEPLRAAPVKNWYRLDPQRRLDGQPHARWHVIENLSERVHA